MGGGRADTDDHAGSGLPGAAMRDLEAAGTLHSYRARTYLFHQGDPAHDVYLHRTGRIEIASVSPNGHRILHAVIERPQLFGELGVVGEITRTATALALEASEVWSIAGDTFLELLDAHPALSRRMLAILARQLAAHEEFVEDVLFLDLKGRVAKRLIRLGGGPEAAEPGVTLPDMTHSDLADQVGGSRENVTRVLSELKRRGIVSSEGRRLRLDDVDALRRLAGR
ncbi:MAG: Crp/Fnr family transcriptional regulator [Actinobacteria bacterium]|nr:Crp/Fnr family transcriptional regulator [Actinomycetota bacterium]